MGRRDKALSWQNKATSARLAGALPGGPRLQVLCQWQFPCHTCSTLASCRSPCLPPILRSPFGSPHQAPAPAPPSLPRKHRFPGFPAHSANSRSHKPSLVPDLDLSPQTISEEGREGRSDQAMGLLVYLVVLVPLCQGAVLLSGSPGI